MSEYRVIWQIDVHAESPRDAAEHAAAIVRKLDLDDECGATVFDVYERPDCHWFSADTLLRPFPLALPSQMSHTFT